MGGVRYGRVMHAQTKIPNIGAKVQGASMDESPSSKERMVMAWDLYKGDVGQFYPFFIIPVLL